MRQWSRHVPGSSATHATDDAKNVARRDERQEPSGFMADVVQIVSRGDNPSDMSEPEWLAVARELQGIAQAGLAYSQDRFDRQRSSVSVSSRRP